MKQNNSTNENIDKHKTQHNHPFTIHEDQILYSHILKYGPKNWSVPARLLPGRTPKQCRERWHNHLDPSINKGPWKLDEDITLAQKQKELGNKWADIAKFLPGRTDTLVKNRWNISVKNRANELLNTNPIISYKQVQQPHICQWIDSFSGQEVFLIPGIIPENFCIPPLLLNKKTV